MSVPSSITMDDMNAAISEIQVQCVETKEAPTASKSAILAPKPVPKTASKPVPKPAPKPAPKTAPKPDIKPISNPTQQLAFSPVSDPVPKNTLPANLYAEEKELDIDRLFVSENGNIVPELPKEAVKLRKRYDPNALQAQLNEIELATKRHMDIQSINERDSWRKGAQAVIERAEKTIQKKKARLNEYVSLEPYEDRARFIHSLLEEAKQIVKEQERRTIRQKRAENNKAEREEMLYNIRKRYRMDAEPDSDSQEEHPLAEIDNS